MRINDVEKFLLQMQKQFCEALAKEDGSKIFITDEWQRPEGGYGITCSLEDGTVIERGGVNFSHVSGDTLPSSASAQKQLSTNTHFNALGISLIIHPRNPYAPTTHFNVRYFQTEQENGTHKWWFGGGFDLTPYYGFIEDCTHWHSIAKQACTPFGDEVHAHYKKACDDYFYLTHRAEPRGIGGLFFDDLHEWGFDQCFAFMQSIAQHFLPAYLPILARRKNIPYGERERAFQTYRRGRYVEFNLVQDRGTLFGLHSKGRIESILMSMPPVVTWQYQWQPLPGSAEEQLYKEFLIVKDWV